MEARLGSDFSNVRVHTGDQAARSAAAVSAKAYTVGNEVVFGPGYFDPASLEGRQRLVHELVHVQQQRQGPVSGTDSGGGVMISDPADSFEQEAEATATRVVTSPRPVARADLHDQHRDRPPAQPTGDLPVQRCGGMPCDCAADEQATTANHVQRDDDTQDSTAPGASLAPTDALPGPDDATPGSGDITTGTVEPLVGADSGLVEEDGALAGEAPADGQPGVIEALPLQRDDAGAATVRYPAAFTVDPHEWGDFQGRPDGSGFAAQTAPKISLDANGFTINALIDSAKSWVRPSAIGDGKKRNSADAKVVADCHAGFRKGYSSYQVTPDATCPAGAAIASSPAATTDGECETVVGAALDRDRVAGTDRLFRHELYHMRLAYAVAASAKPSSDRRADLAKVKRANNVYQGMYDDQTDHGCKLSQSSWEQKIDAGNLDLDSPG
jgi:Domain of unknown function (DUF4157)